MAAKSLEDRIGEYGNPALMLQNSQVGPYVFPVAPQYSNWIEEVRAWRNSAVLLNQSYHMTDLYVRGPDTSGCWSGSASTASRALAATRPSS